MDFINHIAKHTSIEALWAIIFAIFTVMIAYIIYKTIISVRWWRKSAKFVKEEAKAGDEVYVSLYSRNCKIISKNDDGTFDVVLRVHGSSIYTKDL